jgi:hypothetical protein
MIYKIYYAAKLRVLLKGVTHFEKNSSKKSGL